MAEKERRDEVKELLVETIDASPYQPRTIFDDERIDQLCQTIQTHGVIQPIVVREKNGRYELIAGERRLRAVKKLELKKNSGDYWVMNDTQTASFH